MYYSVRSKYLHILCNYSQERSDTCPENPKDKLPAVTKRKVHLKWDDYFMAMACLASARRGSLKGKPAVGSSLFNLSKFS